MKILMIIHHLKSGGPAKQAQLMEKYLKSAGNEVELYTISKKTGFLHSLRDLTKSYRELKKKIKYTNYDIIQVFDAFYAGFIGIKLKLKFNIPVILRVGTVIEDFYMGRIIEKLAAYVEYGPLWKNLGPADDIRLRTSQKVLGHHERQYTAIAYDPDMGEYELPFLRFEILTNRHGNPILRIHQPIGVAYRVDQDILKQLAEFDADKVTTKFEISYTSRFTIDGKPWVILDMDGTVIEETLDDLALQFGVQDEVGILTRQAMSSTIDNGYDDLVKSRLNIITKAAWDRGKEIGPELLLNYARTIPLAFGAAELVDYLKRDGYNIALVSGGFSIVVEQVALRLGADAFVANELVFGENGLLPYETIVTVNGNKDKIVREIKRRHHPSAIYYIGDGSNDVPAMKLEGVIGIATYTAHDLTKTNADYVLTNNDLFEAYNTISVGE